MLTAKEIMTAKPIAAKSSDTIQTVTDLFTKYELTSIPIVNTIGHVLGVITEISILKAYVRAVALKGLNTQVSEHLEIMEPVVSVLETDTIQSVVQSVVKASIHRVVVVDGLGHLRGVIGPKDLLSALNQDGDAPNFIRDALRDSRDKVRQDQG